MVARLLALILLAATALGQAATWTARATSLSGCPLEALLVEMEAREPSIDRSDADFARAYVLATRARIGWSRAEGCVEPDLEARVERARRAARAWGFPDDQASVEQELAKTLLEEGDLARAEDVLLRVREALPEARRAQAENAQLLHELLVSSCRYAEAERLGEAADVALRARLDLERASGSDAWFGFLTTVRISMLGDRAQVKLQLGLPDQAARLLDEQQRIALEEESRTGDSSLAIRPAIDRATLWHALEDYERVRAECRRMLDGTIELVPGERALFRLYGAIAESEIARGVPAEEAASVDAFESLLEEEGAPAFLHRDARIILASLELRRGRFSECETHLDRFEEDLVAAAGRGDCHLERLRERMWTYRTSLALDTGAPAADLRRLRDRLHASNATLFARIRSVPARAAGVGFLHFADPRFALSETIRVEIALEGEEEGARRALATLVEAQALGSFARAVGAATADLEEIRARLLGEDLGLLVYLPALERSHLLLIDARGIEHVELANRDVLVAAVQAFAIEVATPPAPVGSPDADPARATKLAVLGRRSRELLLPEAALARIAGWRGMYVVGADLLAHAPFECLPLPSGRALGVDVAIAHLPSLPIGVWLARRASERGSEPERSGRLFVAAPLHSADVEARWPRLEPIVLDVDARTRLDDAVPSARATFLEGDRATAGRLAALSDGSLSSLSVFAHGVLDPARERPAVIVLSGDGDDGLCGCEEIELGLRAPPLVALYCCGSARGPSRLGDDVAGQLASAFLRQGADTVVSSRAKLGYAAMLELAPRFDAELSATGRSSAEALRRARAALARDERWNDPFHYGLVACVGLGWSDASVHDVHARGTAGGDPPPSTGSRRLVLALGVACAGGLLLAARAVSRARRRPTG